MLEIAVAHGLVFVLGLIVGSFLNVCIFRIPQGISIVWPHSYCPSCHATLRWYHNIPILSFIFLRGHCSFCGESICLRYPLVELLTGVLFFLIFRRFGFHLESPVYWMFVSALIVTSFIDLDCGIIPDIISLPGIALGVVSSFVLPGLSMTDSMIGALLGGGLLFLIAVAYKLLKKIDGMGGGDIKLMAMIGAFLGWKSVFLVIFISSAVGCLIGIPLTLIRGEGTRISVPFGPFLAFGAVIYLLYGEIIIRWYVGSFL